MSFTSKLNSNQHFEDRVATLGQAAGLAIEQFVSMVSIFEWVAFKATDCYCKLRGAASFAIVVDFVDVIHFGVFVATAKKFGSLNAIGSNCAQCASDTAFVWRCSPAEWHPSAELSSPLVENATIGYVGALIASGQVVWHTTICG